jgi:hypothetical protein
MTRLDSAQSNAATSRAPIHAQSGAPESIRGNTLSKRLNEFGGRLGEEKFCAQSPGCCRAPQSRATGQPARNSRQGASSHSRCAMGASCARKGSRSIYQSANHSLSLCRREVEFAADIHEAMPAGRS